MSAETVLFETWQLSNTNFSESQINSLAATWCHGALEGEAAFEILDYSKEVSTGTESKTVAFYYVFIYLLF